MLALTRLLLALAVFHPAAAPAQANVEALVTRIRQEVQRVDALRLTAQHRIELEGFSLEGGEARVFLEGGRVARIAVTHLGESGRTVETIYFRGNSPIFVFRRSMRYDRPHGRVQSTAEDRFYFDRNRMIRWRGADQNLVPRSTPKYAEEEAAHLRFAAALLRAARSRAPRLAAD